MTQSVAVHIRRAKAADPSVRISDFQIRVEAGRTALVNLKTGEVRIIPAPQDTDHFVEFCDRAEQKISGRRTKRA